MARRRKKAATATLPDQPLSAPQPKEWQWWLLAAAIPLAACALKLDLDLWSDEAYTLIFFVSKPFARIATDYSAPNNHVLYSLLLRPFYLVSDCDFMLRLPSLLFTAGSLLVVFRLVRRWSNPAAAASATLALGLTQMFLVYTMQVRGYGLSMFLAAWLGDLAMAEKTGRRQLLGIVFCGAAFLYVLPTNVLFLVPLAAAAVAWTAVRDRSWRSASFMGIAWAAACGLAGLIYLPIADQVLSARGDPIESPFWPTVGLARQVFATATRDWLPVLPLVLLGLVVWAGRVRRERSRKDVVLPLVTLAMLAGPFALTALMGIGPFPRSYCPLLPFLAVAIGWPLAELAEAAGRRLRTRWPEAATAAVVMAVLAVVALPKIITYPARLAEYRRTHFAQDGYYDYYAADFHPADVVAYLQSELPENRSYLVCFSDADHFSLVHYFGRAGLPWEREVPGSPAVVYTITPPLAGYEALSKKYGLPAESLESLPLVRDFGYYRLCRFPEPLSTQP
jgi:hypothetical protein